MNSINDKSILTKMLNDKVLVKILKESKNSDDFRKEFINHSFEYHFRIKRFALNSLYFKLKALQINNEIELKKIV
jgi:deoxyadenosine/deoxycytidine kinase